MILIELAVTPRSVAVSVLPVLFGPQTLVSVPKSGLLAAAAPLAGAVVPEPLSVPSFLLAVLLRVHAPQREQADEQTDSKDTST